MTILVGQRTRPDLNLTFYDETKCSICHTPYTYDIFHPVISYYFLSHMKLFQAGNFNVNVRPDLLYFSIWGVYLKNVQKHNLWPVKTAKTLFTSSKRLIWGNVIHFYEDQCCASCFKSEGKKTECPSYVAHFPVFLHNCCVQRIPIWRKNYRYGYSCGFIVHIQKF